MHLSLGGILKGVTTGLETLAETGNPFVAAGAGALACFSGGNGHAANTSFSAPAMRPLLDELHAENPYEQNRVNALSSYADLIAA